MGIWFNLFQKEKFTKQWRTIKTQTPKLYLNSRLNIESPNYFFLIEFYKELIKNINETIGIHQKHDENELTITSKKESISEIDQQLNELLSNHQKDIDALVSIEAELPSLGVDLLNHAIQSRLFLAGEDDLQRFIEYIPDNIPWQDNAIPQFKEAAKKFLETFSVISVTSLSIKNGFPLSPNLFDLVVIDEASQCDIASAIPLIFRGKQLVVIGDPLQLKHISKVEAYEEKYLQEHSSAICLEELTLAQSLSLQLALGLGLWQWRYRQSRST